MLNSLQLLNNALSYLRFFLKHKFEIYNRAPKDFETIAKKHQQQLLDSKDRTKKFNQKLKRPTLHQRERLLTIFQIQRKKIQYKTKRISEKRFRHISYSSSINEGNDD